MVRSSTLNSALTTNQNQTFKAVNNLLTLQENHVEEFFQYHGEDFLAAFEKMMEDVIERVVSKMLCALEFSLDTASGHIKLIDSCMSEYQRITQENIDLDISTILATAVNSEVIMQRKMAKQQYLESQGFSPSTTGQNTQNTQNAQMTVNQGVGMGAAQGGYGGAAMGINQGMQSGYPIPPNGYDQMNNPYWIDPQSGQMTYSPPNSGMGLGGKLVKAAAWAKWLA
tara:strand:+ start:1860 stop:2537 length:678 start_codon:yes stop_codon:yes gene_type:complete